MEGVTAFTFPYLSAGAPALGEAKGLISENNIFGGFLSMSVHFFINFNGLLLYTLLLNIYNL